MRRGFHVLIQAVGYYLLALPGLLLLSGLLWWGLDQQNPFVIPHLAEASTLFFFWVLLCAPVIEEVFFREYLLTKLSGSPKFGPWRACMLTAVLFASLHGIIAWLPLFYLGLVLGYLRVKTKNLSLVIGIHILHNLTVVSSQLLLSNSSFIIAP